MQGLRSRHLVRTICAGLIALQLNTLSFLAWADAIQNSSNEAQALGSQVLQAFPASNPTLSLQDIFPDIQDGSTTELQDVFGDDNKTLTVGAQANTRLKDEASEEGDAYRLLTESSKRISPDLSKDPMFNQADQVRSGDYMATFKTDFADCSRQEKFENTTTTNHIANYQTCERVADQGGSYQLNHDYKVGIVEYISGQPNFQSCGPGCLYVWIGDVADNNLGGWCAIYEKYVRYRVINRDAIISAKLDYIQWDDFAEIHLNDQRVWLNPVGFFPETAADLPPGYSCEYVGNLGGTGTLTGGGVDITEQFKSEQDIQTFKMRVSVGNRGEIYARIKILFDPSKAFVDNGWGPEDKLPVLDMIKDGFCTNASVQCTNMPEKNGNGCVVENGVEICSNYMPPSPHPSLDPFCRKADVTAECAFYKGPLDCYTDAQGVQRCPANEGGNLNGCNKYEDNPQCGFISQKCIKGAGGVSGQCYAYEEIWDCGYDVTVPTLVNTGAQIECPGGARCMGSECFDTSNVKSKDFAYAVAMLQVAQFAEHDLDCGGDGSDINQSNDCKVFNGEAMECKKALGGYVDCCEAPEGVSVFDYVNLTMNSLKMMSTVEALSRQGLAGAGNGYWQAVQNGALDGISTLMSGEWGSTIDAASGAFTDTLAGSFVSEIQQWLMQQAYDAMVEMGATTAANAVFATGTDGAVTGLTNQMAAVVNVIGMIYTIYVITDMLIKVIWECEEKEFELGAKKETRQCSFVGSYCASKALGSCIEKREAYCCFGSVVGRIIQEQGREQLGMSFGEPETPTCEGLTPTQLGQLDWDKIDLSEWVGMLSMAGRLPTPSASSLEQLTGSGSSLGNVFDSSERKNTLDRNIERLNGVDVDAARLKAEQEIKASSVQQQD